MKICESCDRQFEDDELERCPDDGGRLYVVGTDKLIGTTVDDRFAVDALIGTGGMGKVYLAHQTSVDRRVALKVLKTDISDDPMGMKRFFREAKTASRLNHPNAITVHDFGQTADGMLYLAMELVDGEPLSQRLAAKGRMAIDETLEIGIQICNAMEAAHQLGIVHRDLKPDNIMLTNKPGYRNFVKVLDFGLAKLRFGEDESMRTRSGNICGTPQYMSPEQARGLELDGRSDIYAFGLILYEMLVGHPPFDATSPSMLLIQHIQDQPLPISKTGVVVPAPVENLVMRCLAKQQAGRPLNAAQLRSELRRAAESGAVIAPVTDDFIDDTLSYDDLHHPALRDSVRETATFGPATITNVPTGIAPPSASPASGLASAPAVAAPQQARGWIWGVLLFVVGLVVIVVIVKPWSGSTSGSDQLETQTPGNADAVSGRQAPARQTVVLLPDSRSPDTTSGPIGTPIPSDMLSPKPTGRADTSSPKRDSRPPNSDPVLPRRDTITPDLSPPPRQNKPQKKPAFVLIRVSSLPSGARVYRGRRKKIGTTPLTLKVKPGSAIIRLRLEKSGYRKLTVSISQKSAQRLYYKLKPLKRRDTIFRPIER